MSSSESTGVKKQVEKVDSQVIDSNLTLSTKLSTEQLIFKSPQCSNNNSINRQREKPIFLEYNNQTKCETNFLLYHGVLHFIFGFLMLTFGCLVIHYDANLSQLGGGIWSGCLAMSTGILAILASSKETPFSTNPQKILHTICLAVSLSSLAIAQLVVALAVIGTVRDLNSSEFNAIEASNLAPPGKITIQLPANYMAILTNFGLLLGSIAEFALAACTSYKSSRLLCPCFRSKSGRRKVDGTNRNEMVSSWLGKIDAEGNHQQPIYVVSPAGSTMGRLSSKTSSLTPIFAIPAHPGQVRYPLIPAPLGFIPPPPPHLQKRTRRPTKPNQKSKIPPAPKQMVHKTKTKPIKVFSEVDAVKTYTGLDKTIAEEFIDICDSRHASSESSCCGGNSSVCEAISKEYLLLKK